MKLDQYYQHGTQVVCVSVSKNGVNVSQPRPLESKANYWVHNGNLMNFVTLYRPGDVPTIVQKPITFETKVHVYASVELVEQAKAFCIERFKMTTEDDIKEIAALMDRAIANKIVWGGV